MLKKISCIFIVFLLVVCSLSFPAIFKQDMYRELGLLSVKI